MIKEKYNLILAEGPSTNSDYEYLANLFNHENLYNLNVECNTLIGDKNPNLNLSYETLINKTKSFFLLDSIFNKFLSNTLDYLEHKKNIGKLLYSTAFKNELWFEFIIYSLLLFYVKSDENKEDEILKLFFGILNDHKAKFDCNFILYSFNNKPKNSVVYSIKSIKNEHYINKESNDKLNIYISKFLNSEDNYFYAILKNTLNFSSSSYYKSLFFYESIENVFGYVDNKDKCKHKHKKLLLLALEYLKTPLIDYHLLILSYKFKNESSKLIKKDIEIEKNNIRLFMKNYDNMNNYILNVLLMCFNKNDKLIYRKNLLFVILVIIRFSSINFFTKLIKFLTHYINTHSILNYDYSILFEIQNFNFSTFTNSNSYIMCVKAIIFDFLICQSDNILNSSNTSLVKNTNEYNQKNQLINFRLSININEENSLNKTNEFSKFVERFNCLYYLIELFETLSKIIEKAFNKKDINNISYELNKNNNIKHDKENLYQNYRYNNFKLFYKIYYEIQSKIISLFYFPKCINVFKKDLNFFNNTIIDNIKNFNENKNYTFKRLFNINKFDISKKLFIEDKNIFLYLKEYYIENYNDFYKVLNMFFNFQNKQEYSIIYSNWLILLFKERNYFITYYLIKNLILTQKTGTIIYFITSLNQITNYFIPNFWDTILNLIINTEKKSFIEKFWFISNIKYIFYYNIISINTKKISLDEINCFDNYNTFCKNFISSDNLIYLTNNFEFVFDIYFKMENIFNFDKANYSNEDYLCPQFNFNKSLNLSEESNLNSYDKSNCNIELLNNKEYLFKIKNDILAIFYVAFSNLKKINKFSKYVNSFLQYYIDKLLLCENNQFTYEYVKSLCKQIFSLI